MFNKKLLSIIFLSCFYTQSMAADEWSDYVEKIKNAFVKCGDSYIIYYDGYRGIPTESSHKKSLMFRMTGIENIQNDGQLLENQKAWDKYLETTIGELKDVSFRVRPRLYKTRSTKATKADVLNGEAGYEGQLWDEWDVTIEATYKAIRGRGILIIDHNAIMGWSRWDSTMRYENKLSFSISKKRNLVKYKIGDSMYSTEFDLSDEFFKPSCSVIPKMSNDQCKKIAPRMAELVLERQQMEFKEHKTGRRPMPYNQQGAQLQMLEFCNSENMTSDMEVLIEAYNTPLPSLVPGQYWMPNQDYCAEEREIKKKEMAHFDEEQSRELHKSQRVCEEKLRRVTEQWTSEHP